MIEEFIHLYSIVQLNREVNFQISGEEGLPLFVKFTAIIAMIFTKNYLIFSFVILFLEGRLQFLIT